MQRFLRSTANRFSQHTPCGQASSPQLQQLVAHHAAPLAAALLGAAADTCPRQVLRALAACLYCLLLHPAAGPQAQAQLRAEVSAPGFGGAWG